MKAIKELCYYYTGAIVHVEDNGHHVYRVGNMVWSDDYDNTDEYDDDYWMITMHIENVGPDMIKSTFTWVEEDFCYWSDIQDAIHVVWKNFWKHKGIS